MRKKGLALIAVIIIILFVGLSVLAVTGFIANRFSGFNVQQRLMRCMYNAQAGLQYAIYQYRSTGTAYSASNVAIDAGNSFSVRSTSGAASAIIIDARSTILTNSNRRVSNWTIRNNSAAAVTINQVTVVWNKTPKTLTSFVVNSVTRWSGSIANPPAVFAVSLTIPANTTYPTGSNLNQVIFNSSAAGDPGITLAFRLSDGTTTAPCTIYPAQASTCTQAGGNLTIQSTGRTTGSTLYKSVAATYNTATGNISDYDEIATAVP